MVRGKIKKVMKREGTIHEVSPFILGILSIVGAFITPILGIVFGIIGLKKSKDFALAKKMNILGLIFSVLILIISIFFIINLLKNSTLFGEIIKQVFMIKI